MSVISNTTVLSNFAAINQLTILRELYTKLYISAQVYEEILEGKSDGYRFCVDIEQAIVSINPEGWLYLASMKTGQELATYTNLPRKLHAGESSCLAIALHRNWIMLTDDKTARNAAIQNQIQISGTLGCLILSVERELLNLREANQYLEQMIKQGYYAPVSKLDDFI